MGNVNNTRITETSESLWNKPIVKSAVNFACAIAAILQVGLYLDLARINSTEYKEAKERFLGLAKIKFYEQPTAKDNVSVFGFRATSRRFNHTGSLSSI
ncbi:MAG: hypothetical protein HZB76_04605 [Chlamydiae bacterium]|nr:hypothetical protein [Chlamydiota bacterium]